LLIAGGGFHTDSAKRLVDDEQSRRDIVVMFGRLFILTLDLPFRIKAGLELNQYKRDTFYTPKSPTGYADYEFSKGFHLAAPMKSR
jgi:NADPH2 dehydrogenase